ncbi:hypothetical protein OBBRIDRAFT_838993 [Obba rivulosa]|uniref:Oxidoreductase AflY n=1 Tax=Obba rivulosa TaxID=1052685 RepID=A0A8E2DH14_9APHY|nr:hypothetical protein OBBRIDRAFT_838993 [Obba rivulosa]
MTSSKNIDALFPPPAPPPTSLFPARLPGATPESAAVLSELLKENYEKWHIYFNDKGFHNHISHHLLAIYALGAQGPLLRAAYEADIPIQRSTWKSPSKIDEKNFHDHLGDENYWDAYLEFFSGILLEKSAEAVIEEYIFSPRVNIEQPEPGKPPMKMLTRFLSGVMHPMIHTGYAAEFGLLGLVAEGLAQAAVHKAEVATFVPDALFQKAPTIPYVDSAHASVSHITSLFPSLVLGKPPGKAGADQSTDGVHALTVVARILNDPVFAPESIGLPVPLFDTLDLVARARGDLLASYAEEWTVDATSAEAIESKIEELIWVNVVLYGIGGWTGRKSSDTGAFNADFLLMHGVTSALFLHSLTAYLSPASASMLLRAYFTNWLGLWIARGRPALPIRDFYNAVTVTPTEPGISGLKPADGTLLPEDISPNPFLPILQTSMKHPDEHLCKCQRALAHFAVLYGTRPKGHFHGLSTVSDPKARLEGAELLDGTLFIRVAGLTANELGWMREGQAKRAFSFTGFFQ